MKYITVKLTENQLQTCINAVSNDCEDYPEDFYSPFYKKELARVKKDNGYQIRLVSKLTKAYHKD